MEKNKNLILGSGSPRRKELLQLAGIPFVQKIIEVEETYPADLPASEVAEYLALKKAKAGLDLLKTDQDILLTADSVVIFQHQIFGKPADKKQAFEMLKQLSGQWHTVITGVALYSKSKQRSFSSVSNVCFESLSDKEIDYYIEHFKPFDKAGAYGIQDWIGWCKISRIEGLYSNIMGLPVQLVYEELEKF